MQIEKLRRQNCEQLWLWVDEMRVPARRLYEGLGFSDENRLTDYYAPGRVGVRMVLSLLPPTKGGLQK